MEGLLELELELKLGAHGICGCRYFVLNGDLSSSNAVSSCSRGDSDWRNEPRWRSTCIYMYTAICTHSTQKLWYCCFEKRLGMQENGAARQFSVLAQ